MSSIRWQPNDPNIYLYVEGRWYRYLSTSAPVGEGAMGIVYLGFDCMTNEKVAIKMLRQEFWHDQQIRNRLRLEASISISHPNIIRMLGYCEDSSMTGPLYVLSEYIYGVTFKAHVEQLSNVELNREDQFNKIVTEFLPAMDAVDHLHSLGVIHRDIKPANLMFQDGNTLKLMDLGIAKADYFFDAHLKGFIGSKPFAAPEQIVDDNTEAKIDHRVDIYALGVTLSYLLVGHFPISASDKVPRALVQIIDKATSEIPEERYEYAFQMRNSLSEYLMKSGKEKRVSHLAIIIILFIAILAIILSILFL